MLAAGSLDEAPVILVECQAPLHHFVRRVGGKKLRVQSGNIGKIDDQDDG